MRRAVDSETKQVRYMLPGLLLLIVISILPNLGANALPPEAAQIRLAIGHSGLMLASTDDLPPDIAA